MLLAVLFACYTRPVLENRLSAHRAFEYGAGFYGRFVAKVFVACIVTCSRALHICDDVKMHRVVFLFKADQFDFRIARGIGEVAQKLRYEGIARRDAVDIRAFVIQLQRGDIHSGRQFGFQ